MDSYGPAGLLPERTPTWSDIVLTVFAIMQVGLLTRIVDVSWPAFALGAALFAALFGPVAASTIGERVNQWADSIGKRGRGLVIVLFAVLVWIGANTLPVSAAVVTSFGSGGFVAVALIVALQLLTAREVDGWT